MQVEDLQTLNPDTSTNPHWEWGDKIYLPPNPDVIGVSSSLKPKPLKMVFWPNKMLSTECEDVVTFDEELQQLVYDMAYTMFLRKGIGIAAPQVGKTLNIIIIDDGYRMYGMVNPRLVKVDEKNKYKFTEGCLSVPGYYEDRRRPSNIVVEYKSPRGREVEEEFNGLSAFVIQHEIDHLKGKVFVDGLSRFKQDRIIKKVKKLRGR